MSITLNTTTELEAVNTMLSAISEAPVNSLGSGLPDAEVAEGILREVNRSVQSNGWNFNTELSWELTPDVNGELILPKNCLGVDEVQLIKRFDSDYVLRGHRLYDRIGHTFKIEKPITVDMVVLLPFDQLPEQARVYITLRAARVFQDRVLGSNDVHSFTAQDEETARVRLNSMKFKTGDYNMKNNSTVFGLLNRRF